MTKDLQFTTVSVTFCFPLHPSAPFQKQRRSSASLVRIALVLLVLSMEGVTGSAIASPEAKALLQAKACGACHIIPGIEEAYGKAGPSLKGLHKRKRLFRGGLENNLENLKAWLKNPDSIKPGTLMPNTGLTDEEVEIVIRYLNTI